jgi:NADP-dependent 3-hydroxy acid dehydrogenase YdfG
MRFPDHPIAVITGASSGIGAATAEALAGEGWRVVLVARRAQKLEEVAAGISASGGQAMVEALDAADGEAVLAMAERVRATWGVPLLAVNSAGAGVWRFLEETTPEETAQMMGAPFFAAAYVSRAFLGDMIAAGRGLLVHVGSPASLLPWPGATAYSASRWALRGLHEALCQDLRGTGVHSSHVVFGEVSSDYFEANPDSRQYIPKIAAWTPVSTPQQCAEVILRTVRRPRKLVIYPAILRLFYLCDLLLPAPTRWIVARTGRRH